jgi:hypothetical protein
MEMIQQLFSFHLEQLIPKRDVTESNKLPLESQNKSFTLQNATIPIVTDNKNHNCDFPQQQSSQQNSLHIISSPLPSSLSHPQLPPSIKRELNWVDILKSIECLEQTLNQIMTNLSSLKSVVLIKCSQPFQETQ